MTTATDTPTPTPPQLDALLERFPAPPLHRDPTDWEAICWDLVRGGTPPVGTTHWELRGAVRELWGRAASIAIVMTVLAAPLLVARATTGQ